MSPHDRIVDTSRQAQATVRVVAGVYVAIGLVLTFYSANEGHVVNTFIGFLIVNLAIVGGLVVAMLMRLGERVSLMAERLDRLDHALARVEGSMHQAEVERREALAAVMDELRMAAPSLVDPAGRHEPLDDRDALLDGAWVDEVDLEAEVGPTQPSAVAEAAPDGLDEPADAPAEDDAAASVEAHRDEPAPEPAAPAAVDAAARLAEQVESIDLTAIGVGDPAQLACAVLDRDRFPRLAAVMEEPRDESAIGEAAAGDERGARPAIAVIGVSSLGFGVALPGDAPPAGQGATAINMMRRWGVAMRDGDLAAAREVFSTLVDTADADWVAEMRRSLDDLGRRVESRLRSRFSRCVRDGDLEGALAAGEEILAQLPDRPIADDFTRIRPHILRRLDRSRAGCDLVPS